MRARCLSTLAPLLLAAAAAAQSTAFTYQGQLKNGTALTTGPHDFRFRLFDAASGGAQVGPTVCVDNVAVSAGLFTTTIDFGQQFATTSPRFLDIQVRQDIGQPCTDDFGYVLLSPRKPLAATPLASHARSAFALDAPDGSPLNAVFVNNSGNVGIGTLAPSVPLHIARDLDPVMILQDIGPASTQAGYVGFWNNVGSETGWVGFGTPGSPHLAVLNARSGGDVVLQPASGRVRLGSAGEYFAPGGEENLRIIRGRISTTGATLQGAGFSSQRVAEGTYTITLNTPFSGPPVATANSYVIGGASRKFVEVNAVDANAVSFWTIHGDTNTRGDALFDFIIVGPR